MSEETPKSGLDKLFDFADKAVDGIVNTLRQTHLPEDKGGPKEDTGGTDTIDAEHRMVETTAATVYTLGGLPHEHYHHVFQGMGTITLCARKMKVEGRIAIIDERIKPTIDMCSKCLSVLIMSQE